MVQYCKVSEPTTDTKREKNTFKLNFEPWTSSFFGREKSYDKNKQYTSDLHIILKVLFSIPIKFSISNDLALRDHCTDSCEYLPTLVECNQRYQKLRQLSFIVLFQRVFSCFKCCHFDAAFYSDFIAMSNLDLNFNISLFNFNGTL